MFISSHLRVNFGLFVRKFDGISSLMFDLIIIIIGFLPSVDSKFLSPSIIPVTRGRFPYILPNRTYLSKVHFLSTHVRSFSSFHFLLRLLESYFLYFLKYLFISHLIFPIFLVHSSPYPHFKCLQSIDFIFRHCPCLRTIWRCTPHNFIKNVLFQFSVHCLRQ